MGNKLNHKVHALLLAKRHLGLPDRENGLRHRGVRGGDHMVTDERGRWFAVDLVLGTVAMCVGVVPTPVTW